MDEILFLGTGIMGAPMASNIMSAGFAVKAWNRSTHKSKALSSKGIIVVENLQDLSKQKRIVIVMLSSGDVVDTILFGNDKKLGVTDLLSAGSVVIVMSSIPVETACRQAAILKEKHIQYLDAPVSGGEAGAKNASLSIMAGGSSTTLEKIKPILASMGRVTHVGQVGTGQLAKLANQTIVGITICAVAEALVLAEIGGADPEAVKNALDGGFADSTVLQQHGERMLSRDFQPGAFATTQLKDLQTAIDCGTKAGGVFPMLSLCKELYENMCNSPREVLDHSAIFLEIRDKARVKNNGTKST